MTPREIMSRLREEIGTEPGSLLVTTRISGFAEDIEVVAMWHDDSGEIFEKVIVPWLESRFAHRYAIAGHWITELRGRIRC